jgi:hypothetical protein
MSERNTAPQAPEQGGIRPFLSPAAIIVAALAAATTALLRPIIEASTENAVLVATLLSVATTTSTAVYKAGVDKITQGYRGRRWRPPLFAGLLAGLAACLLGISVVSGAELALGKEPSILPDGTPIIPIALVSYYFDADGDTLGSGNPVDYERGSQPPRWVQKSGDKCPDIPGPPENDGCPYTPPPPPLLIFYYFDSDGDGVGAEPPPAQQYQRGTQPLGWVELKGDNCPDISGPHENAGCPSTPTPPQKKANPQ